LAREAMDAVKSGLTMMIPEREEMRFYQWMEEIKDWCISRQLWWGHQIPVWYCSNRHEICQLEAPTKCPTCGGSVVAGDVENKPRTFVERCWKNSCLKFSDVNVWKNSALPVLSDLRGNSPEAIGEDSYIWYSGWNMTDMNINYHTGVCLDVQICKDNPIFKDYQGDTRKIRWVSGPEFIFPDQ